MCQKCFDLQEEILIGGEQVQVTQIDKDTQNKIIETDNAGLNIVKVVIFLLNSLPCSLRGRGGGGGGEIHLASSCLVIFAHFCMRNHLIKDCPNRLFPTTMNIRNLSITVT